MNKLVICIFPKDTTTDFLEPIFNAAKNMSEDFAGYRIDTTNEGDVTRLKTRIEALDNNCTIVFLGHGASNCLYGTPTKGKNEVLFTQKQLSVIKNKTNFIFACNSNELLNSLKSDHYIGFGDMPTDYSEVISEREFSDPTYLSSITEQDLAEYRRLIVDIVVKAITKSKLVSLSELVRYLMLFANIAIVEILTSKNICNFRMLADLIYDWKDAIKYSVK
ncbi:MAG: hypothetical protein R3Y59_09105 [bacterium]